MKTINLLLVFIFSAALINAQTVDDVTLVVSGDGVTKEEATHVALRSAIEQAYGVFVSANTEILNDELVKDEIATVTSGNVKSYKELSATILPNGNHMVSLQAVVSTKKLAAYAETLCKGKAELKFVPCMRMCGKGPNVRWNGTVYHRATKELLQELLFTEGKV